MIDHSHLSTNEAFVADLFDNALDASPMTTDIAAEDLSRFRAEGWDVPEDLTPNEYAEIWNRFCSEESCPKTPAETKGGSKMKKIISDYEITKCTAIAVGVDDARQPALFVHKLDDVNRDGDAVVFGWDLAWLEDDGDLESMFCDKSAWAFDQETLATVVI